MGAVSVSTNDGWNEAEREDSYGEATITLNDGRTIEVEASWSVDAFDKLVRVQLPPSCVPAATCEAERKQVLLLTESTQNLSRAMAAALGSVTTPPVPPLLGAVTPQVGAKTIDNLVPAAPQANQKLPPCLTEAGEVEINGGCYANQGDVKPPCGRYLYRGGDKCYRPIAADPTKPVGAPQ
jgi:hypothetical protein